MTFDKKKHQDKINQVEQYIRKHSADIKQHHWREHYHYQAPVGWINDPHGLVQIDGVYHLFYQHHPFSGKWGTMHWGHATSNDLIHWETLPEALAPSEDYDGWGGGGIFTGSAVNNDGELTLFYTGCAQDRQVQCMATSKDGVNFDKYDGNPIITDPPEGINLHDFRDPKVWKHEGKWYMVTGVTDGVSDLINASNYETNGFGKVCMHRSDDLKKWEFVGYCVESLGELGTMLECPNMFKLGGKHVLMYSPMGLQQRQAIYLVGDLDYKTGKFHWSVMGSVDWGFDYYAPQVFDDEQGRTLIQAWIGSWPFMPWCDGTYDTSDLGWYGSISLPREVSLCQDGKLSFRPVSEVEMLRLSPKRYSQIELSDGEKFAFTAGDNIHCEILADIDVSASECESIVFEIRSKGEQKTLIELDFKRGELAFDRSQSGNISALRRTCALESTRDDQLNIRIFMDSISVEIFTDHGRTTMTNNIFSDETSDGLYVYAKKGNATIRSLKTFGMKKVSE
ncbi:glycoside hydrolase family 32 protein [Vibrio penaeicida]|uniref:glycoside hydrolase family 32 protein n=1 Tax=Vibrio penaeicida TaxID=104609 RepID=UPI002734A368|nr:glycoside hydrolase family 32 protein [Vibrio penaeicida]MDP2574248.1 glycoside hydrolase family 32 protein [Vibrio penaeicida]